MAQVGCVVVTYNRKEDLVRNIEALLKQKYKDMDIIIVDNASTDGTQEALSGYSNIIHYYRLEKNIGGAGGFNYGIKKSVQLENEYCWIMDDDTLPNENSLIELMNSAQKLNYEFAFLCSFVEWVNGEVCKMNIPNFNKDWMKYLTVDKRELLSVDSCSFVSCLINNKLVKQIGYPITDFFIYGDDAEYTRRLSQKGNGYLCLNSVVTHRTKQNVADDICYVESARIKRYYYRFRNNFYILRKYQKPMLIRYILSFFKTIIRIVFWAKDSKYERLKEVSSGFLAGIFYNPIVESYYKELNEDK